MGPSDGGRQPGHQRRPVVEAAALPVHIPLRGVRALPTVAVDDHRAGGIAQRLGLRRPDRLPADRRPGRPPVGRLGRGGLRRPGGSRFDRLLALHAERAVGSDDRRAVSGCDRLPPVETLQVGIRARVPRRARAARGMAVPRPVRDLGLAASAGDALDDRGRDRGPGGALVRHPGAHLAHRLCRRLERTRIRSPAALGSDHGHDRPLRGAEPARARADCGVGGRLGFAAARSRCGGAGGRGGRLGGRRDRVLATRLARARAVHVRARRRGRRPGRCGSRARVGPPAAVLAV